MRKIFTLIFLFFIVFFWKNITFADINLVVTPIKYEIEADKWEKITKTAKIINKKDIPVKLTIDKANFISNNISWEPIFVKETTKDSNLNTELASWISYEEKTFEIWPLETIEIPFDITIPENATPGWHYWAVFFTYTWESEENSHIKIKADYWVLILVKVKWEIIEKIDFWRPSMKIDWWKNYEQFIENETKNIDNCLLDFSEKNYDWNCFKVKDFIDETEKNLEKIKDKINEKINNSENISSETEKSFSNNTWNSNQTKNSEDQKDKKFSIEFNLPFENTWNTHIKPTWKIIIKDENWEVLNNVWKEFIFNNEWNIIWEKIVNYIPINQWWWKILPSTSRIFVEFFEWIYSQITNSNWEVDFSLTNLSDYFSKIESEKKSKLNPWEKYVEEKNFKELTWIIEIWYTDSNWKYIEFNSTSEIKVPYTKKIITFNWYFILFVTTLLLLTYIFFRLLFLLFKRKRKCKNCKKKVKKDMKICPYCMTKLEDETKKSN